MRRKFLAVGRLIVLMKLYKWQRQQLPGLSVFSDRGAEQSLDGKSMSSGWRSVGQLGTE